MYMYLGVLLSPAKLLEEYTFSQMTCVSPAIVMYNSIHLSCYGYTTQQLTHTFVIKVCSC